MPPALKHSSNFVIHLMTVIGKIYYVAGALAQKVILTAETIDFLLVYQ